MITLLADEVLTCKAEMKDAKASNDDAKTIEVIGIGLIQLFYIADGDDLLLRTGTL